MSSPAQPLVFMFSGQGSQYYQMARNLFETQPGFAHQLRMLDALAVRLLHRSVLEIVYDDRRSMSDAFGGTVFTHPAIFMVQYALAATLRERGIIPDYLLGASLGSLVAAAVGGCFDIESGLELVIRQAQILETHCRSGGMLAVLADPQLYHQTAQLREHCDLAGVNFHSHFVLSAPLEGLRLAADLLRNQRIAFQRLVLSHAYHSRWIGDAEQPLRALLQPVQFRPSSTTMVCCAQSAAISAISVDSLWRVLREPILFQQTILALEQRASYRYVDLSPSGTLATFLKYALPGGSSSRVVSVLTPFGQDSQGFERIAQIAAES